MYPKLKWWAIGIGVLYTVLSMIYGLENVWYVKVCMHIVLLAYYISNATPIKWLLPLSFVCAAVGEVVVALGFIENFSYTVVLFTAYFGINAYLLTNLVRSNLKQVFRFNLWTTLIAIATVITVIALMYVNTADVLPDTGLYLLVALSLVWFTGANYFAFYVVRHIKNVLFFNVGTGYLLVCIGTLIYELTWRSPWLLGLVNFCEVGAQLSLVVAMVYYQQFKESLMRQDVF